MFDNAKRYFKRHSHVICYSMGIGVGIIGGVMGATWYKNHANAGVNSLVKDIWEKIPEQTVLIGVNDPSVIVREAPESVEYMATLVTDKALDITKPFISGDYEFVGKLIENAEK